MSEFEKWWNEHNKDLHGYPLTLMVTIDNAEDAWAYQQLEIDKLKKALKAAGMDYALKDHETFLLKAEIAGKDAALEVYADPESGYHVDHEKMVNGQTVYIMKSFKQDSIRARDVLAKYKDKK